MKRQMNRRFLVIFLLVACCLSVAITIIVKSRSKAVSDPYADPFTMIERIENAFDGEYKKQSITVLASTTTYASKDGSLDIIYRILFTTYYDKDPSEVTGLNVEAINALFPTDSMDSCEELIINGSDAAMYKKEDRAYLCWTRSPEITLVLEYNPEVVEESEIIKMAESVEAEG